MHTFLCYYDICMISDTDSRPQILRKTAYYNSTLFFVFFKLRNREKIL